MLEVLINFCMMVWLEAYMTMLTNVPPTAWVQNVVLKNGSGLYLAVKNYAVFFLRYFSKVFIDLFAAHKLSII